MERKIGWLILMTYQPICGYYMLRVHIYISVSFRKRIFLMILSKTKKIESDLFD